MKICVIGGGNIGTLIAAESAYNGYETFVYSSRAREWGKEIDVYSSDDEYLFTGGHVTATDQIIEAVEGASYIFVTVPSQIFPDIANELYGILKPGQCIIAVPGFGGAEFAFSEIIKLGVDFFGMSRVHSIARLKENGRSVFMLGRKSSLETAAIPNSESSRAATFLNDFFKTDTKTLPNYLNVTLTPSNPILHTTRLYSMFSRFSPDHQFDRNIPFYEEWDEKTSKYILACDSELTELCDTIPMDLSGVVPLHIYYERDTAEGLTEKIRGISAFRGLSSPMKKVGDNWCIDWGSRYFTADFCYGLKILIDIADLFDVNVDTMREIWDWYRKTANPDKYFSLNMSKREFLDMYR